jgi:octaprenyl-diphosphate synthase
LLKKYGTLDETRLEALGYAQIAKDAIHELPEHPLRDMLSDLADYVVARIR